jgi:hypothetical protein
VLLTRNVRARLAAITGEDKPAKPSIFLIRVEVPVEIDGLHTIRHALKVLWRRYGLKAIEVREEATDGPQA